MTMDEMDHTTAASETFAPHVEEQLAWCRRRFGGLRPEAREEAVQNTAALAWKHWLAQAKAGRPLDDVGHLRQTWEFAARQTRMGRSIVPRPYGGRERGGDACDRPRTPAVLDAMVGDRTPVPDRAAWAVDMPRFLAGLTARQREVFAGLAAGETTKELAALLGVSPGAVSQFRARFKVLHDAFFEAATA